jgi:integrase
VGSKIVDALKAAASPDGKPDAIVWDEELPGLGIRFRTSSGGRVSKTWCVQYRIGDQQRRESLGDTRKIELTDARKIARQRFAKIELGVDPAAERAAKARSQYTLQRAAADYLEAKRQALRPGTYANVARHLKDHWSALLNKPLAEIDRATVAAALRDIARNHGRMAAGQARKNLSALFTWAAKEGRCEVNPVAFTNDPAEGARPRQRVLSDTELAAMWHACADDDFGRAVRLLVLTGCRRDEIGRLRWSEINIDAGLLSIPGARTKNGQPLDLPLPALALDVLRLAPQRGGERVFGVRGPNGFYGWSYGKLAMDARIQAMTGTPLAPWRIHDIRRSFRTGLSRIGVAPHIAERAINHIKGGVEGVYDRHRFEAEIKEALEAWANHVHTVTTK